MSQSGRWDEQVQVRTMMDRHEVFTDSLLPYHHQFGLIDQMDMVDFAQSSLGRSYLDSIQIQYLQNEFLLNKKQNPKSFWKKIYDSPHHLYSYKDSLVQLSINPVLDIHGDAYLNVPGLYYNQRGLKMRFSLRNRLFAKASILETQRNALPYIDEYIRKQKAVPGQGFYKDYSSEILGIEEGYDYLNGTGSVLFRALPEFDIELGHDRHFIGPGMRSMIWSDFSHPHFYLKLSTRFWKLRYVNLWTELAPVSAEQLDSGINLPRKYAATHYLSMHLSPQFQLGLFESVIFRRSDQFELQYLNPLILYRTIEQGINSPDNVLIGLDFQWLMWKKLKLYGQVVFDEFQWRELFVNGDQWWGNKFATQLGLYYPDAFGVKKLDLQAEWNLARPFSYTHFDSLANHTHYNQALAHPAGANFSEVLLKLHYPFLPKWNLTAWYSIIQQGEDGDEYIGSSILRSYDARTRDYGHDLLQGIRNDREIISLEISYRVLPKTDISIEWFSRNSELSELEWTILFGIRTQIIRNPLLF